MIYIFDVDNTLIDTKAQVKVYDRSTGHLLHSLDSKGYNEYQKDGIRNGENLYIDFGEFNSIDILRRERTLPLFRKLRRLVAQEPSQVYIITNRARPEIIYDWLRGRRIPIKLDHIHCLPTGGVRKTKGEVLREILLERGEDRALVYEDDPECLRSMLEVGGIIE